MIVQSYIHALNPDGLAALLARADDYEQVKAVAEYYAVSKILNI